MPTIGIDCRFASGNFGIGRYAREIASHLVRSSADIKWVLFVRSDSEPWLKNFDKSIRIIQADIPHYSVSEQLRFPAILRRSNIDLLFSPHFNVPFNCPVPFVVTIHDLILHRFPNTAAFTKRCAYKIIMQRAVRKAKSIIAVSHNTKHELCDTYGSLIEKKIHTVHEGIGLNFSPVSHQSVSETLQRCGVSGEYFLYVGNAKEHKNVQFLLNAYEKSNEKNTKLILVSSGPEVLKLSLPSGVSVISDVSEEDLPALYSGATAFVTASLYEGYCFPVLEAAACGCPVIATDCSAISEVALPGSLLLKPDEEAYIAAFRNPPSAPDISLGLPTWEQAAAETLTVFLSALRVS
ncbi:hypothetical protein COU78_02260 [Candidatus Peregrinibacteria bacterium CG10_big_fil_rev_8_21_14_0_10_49_24]|nr:MAG: hypothetical protein COV83_02240 [Candidatus Peregrinibacteria bacterium CG11_big_fil_rev_8_21_14_0_20_49_14]PIR50961.1 MAG: hypothetical protein COU78_02260 [Candidatus Peregrinibacteria bacterium CG10_big_fil_rev_8_21_14_0_10_49_24]PJA67514.1 MAG: hypothetical protein CO157_03740 [Candidatus Peregrinibacteria bacterium CG_4_9_14_3_um_filter_49_12]